MGMESLTALCRVIRCPGAAYFARGTGHDEYAAYTEDPEDWEVNMARLKKKFETALEFTPKPELIGSGKAEIGIIAYGSTEMAVLEAIDYLRRRRYRDRFPAPALPTAA